MLPKSSKRWPLLAKLVTGFCLCLSATDGPGQEARKPSRPVSAVTAGHTPSGESHKSAAGTPRAVLDEDLTNEEETDDGTTAKILQIDLAEISSSPAEMSLEDRLRDLEQRLALQQEENILFRDQLSEIGKKEGDKPKGDKSDPKAFKASWKNQLNFESGDKNFAFHIGGRTQIDTIWLQNNPAAFGAVNGAGSRDATDFRRARLRADGTIYKTIDYVVEYDFVNSVNGNPGTPASASNVIPVTAPTDGYFTFHETPIVGNVKVGLQKEPIGLEHLTSSRHLDLMERSFNQDAYTGPNNNGFSLGASAYNHFGEDDRGWWQTGVFKNSVNPFAYAADDGAYAWTSRLVYLLWDEDEGRKLLHVGGSYSNRDPLDKIRRIRSRGSLRNGPGALNPVFADSGTFVTDDENLYAAEMSMVLGSFQLQSEYIASTNSNATNLSGNHGTYFTNGYYVMASYFLTGEHRAYDKKAGVFGRVIPFRNSRWCPEDCAEQGWGAWQILARYSNLDLNDSGITGGRIDDYTAGVNWFLNPNMKIQANYVFMDRNSPTQPDGASVASGVGGIHGFGMRLCHDF